jgi:hypothetical protein
MVKIGIIVGKDDWYSDSPKDLKGIDKKFLTKNSYMSSDIAIGERIKKKYPDAEVDMMLAKEITLKRLETNDVNFILGHDLVDAFWRKSPKNYYKEFTEIYKNPRARIFPTYPVQKFVLDKGEYYLKFKKAGVPVLPTFYVKNTETNKLTANYIIRKVKQLGWTDFIGKPELGAWGRMFSKWNLNELETNPTEKNKLNRYLRNKKVLHFPAIIFQKSAPGFKEFWEIRTYWFNGKFSHALGTKHDFELADDEVSLKVKPSILEQCKKIGRKALSVLPKMKIGGHIVQPAMVRIDCGCCIDGLNGKYFLNEIENQACNLFTSALIDVDVVGKFAKVFYYKALELKKLGFHAPEDRSTGRSRRSRASSAKASIRHSRKRMTRKRYFSSIPTPGGFEWENSPLDRALNA